MIHGQRILLRAVERSDLPDYVRWLNDPRLLEYFGNYRPLSSTEEERWYEAMLQDESMRAFAIQLEDRHVGNAGFSQIDGRNASAEVGLFIGPSELWAKGLGFDVLQTLLRFGFEQMNLNRIYLRVFAEHKQAVHLYEKLGFVHEGRWRQAEFRHGRYHDLLWMSVLRHEWRA